MRDLVLAAFLFPAALSAIRFPWIGVVLWALVSVMNPHRLAYGFAVNFPWAMLIVVCTFIGLVASKDSKKMIWSPAVVVLVLFTVWQSITYPFSFYVDASTELWTRVIKINFMILVTIAVIETRKQVLWLVGTLAFSLGFYGLKGGIFTVVNGGNYRVQGPDNSFIGGNNELALAICVAIPLMYYMVGSIRQKWGKLALMSVVILSVLSSIGSHSRGALLALSAMAGLLWLKSRSKFGLAIGIALAVGLVIAVMPAEWFDRMNTIKTYDEDASALGRINAWIVAFNVAKDHFFGGGYMMWTPAIFAQYAPDPRDIHVAHSIFFQVMGEHGFVGLALFLVMWLFTWRQASWASRTREIRDDPAFEWARKLGAVLQVSLLGYLVGGTFLSLAYFDLPYYLLALGAIIRKIGERQWADQYRAAPPLAV